MVEALSAMVSRKRPANWWRAKCRAALSGKRLANRSRCLGNSAQRSASLRQIDLQGIGSSGGQPKHAPIHGGQECASKTLENLQIDLFGIVEGAKNKSVCRRSRIQSRLCFPDGMGRPRSERPAALLFFPDRARPLPAEQQPHRQSDNRCKTVRGPPACPSQNTCARAGSRQRHGVHQQVLHISVKVDKNVDIRAPDVGRDRFRNLPDTLLKKLRARRDCRSIRRGRRLPAKKHALQIDCGRGPRTDRR